MYILPFLFPNLPGSISMFLHSNFPPGLSLPARGWKRGRKSLSLFLCLLALLPSDFSLSGHSKWKREKRERYPEAEPTDSANKKPFPCFFLPNERWGISADFRLSFLSCLSQQKPPSSYIASVCSRKRKRGTPEISPHFRTRNILKQSSPFFQMLRVFLTLSHVFPSFFPFHFHFPFPFFRPNGGNESALVRFRGHISLSPTLLRRAGPCCTHYELWPFSLFSFGKRGWVYEAVFHLAQGTFTSRNVWRENGKKGN